MKPFVTVIVPTHKRQELFLKCLDSLARQSYSQKMYEVIVVNDGLDCTYDQYLLKVALSSIKNSYFFTVTHRGVAAVRNFGIEKAKGELIMTIDDDCLADEKWISNHVDFMEENPEVIASGGTVKPSIPKTFIQKYISFKRLLYRPVRDIDGKIITIVTANACYRKTYLDRVGNFNQKFRYSGGEDVDLSMRLREIGKLGYCENSVVNHYHRSSLMGLIKQHIVYGRGTYMACKENEIDYQKLKFYEPNILGFFRYSLFVISRIFTVSIPEFWNKKLNIIYWLPYMLLDIIRKMSFMVGATLEYYKL